MKHFNPSVPKSRKRRPVPKTRGQRDQVVAAFRTCQWIDGHPHDGTVRRCGKPVADPPSSRTTANYCPAHGARAVDRNGAKI